MNLAYLQARKSLGNTLGNPPVGCVIVNKNNEVISYGKTGINGIPHAEYNAIKKIKYKMKNLSLYVTLEPCAHFGKTPPCTKLIIDKQISKVFYSVHDVDKITSKKAKNLLTKKKIKVNTGINKKQIDEFYKFYYKNRIDKLPYVTAKLAISKDFYIKNILNKNITNCSSRKVSHYFRSINNGIMISGKTLLDDDPMLDCRINGLNKFSPTKIILDKNLSIPINSKIIKNSSKNKIIIIYNKKDYSKIEKLKKKKIKLIHLNVNKNKMFNLKKVLKILYKNKIYRLIIEGGKKLTTSLIDGSLIDEFLLFKSNKNLNKNGKINVRPLIKKINFIKKNERLINTNLYNDKIINFKF